MLTAIDLSQKTFARIKLNYAFALDGGVNVILAIPFAIGVFFPWLGFAAATLDLLVQPWRPLRLLLPFLRLCRSKWQG
jgi:cation transport ATPase